MTRRMMWGVSILLILLVCGVTAVLLLRDKGSDPVYVVPPDEPVRRSLHKKPPLGETFTTGHWEGDTWRRTAPPAPETVVVGEEVLSYEELYDRVWHGDKNGIKLPYLKRAIEEYPYSEAALKARYNLTVPSSDSDRELIALKEMLKYHSDSPRLLTDLLSLIYRPEDVISYEEAIEYGKEALKYVDLYPPDSAFGIERRIMCGDRELIS